jgi:hypothetical protein
MIHRNFVRSPMQIISSCISASLSLSLKCVNMTAIPWQGHPSQTTLSAASSPQYTSAWARGRSGTSGHVQEKAPVQLHVVWGAVDMQGAAHGYAPMEAGCSACYWPAVAPLRERLLVRLRPLSLHRGDAAGTVAETLLAEGVLCSPSLCRER